MWVQTADMARSEPSGSRSMNRCRRIEAANDNIARLGLVTQYAGQRLASWLAADQWYARTGQIISMPNVETAFLAGEREFTIFNDQLVRRGPLL